MAQGKLKGLQKKAESSRAAAGNSKKTKKGQRSIAPKKAAHIQHRSLQQSLSAKINNSIEKQMVSAASAGKLTIMKHVNTDSENKAK
ncbi:hypothetical protein BOTBODRAFT_34738 [Botryobasidium botryosum FD-172 SS1]|uniref:Uncharacterized protein n=1 Tax=Botryobasidium botryosum (strain FD-172 SS1) TaxID=930990 RepID=A0A067MBP7_BOTB1|nr:hypothetical protein BOTBODRAFT_34738 [Botryobasidium botryosum FD-172 SS1]